MIYANVRADTRAPRLVMIIRLGAKMFASCAAKPSSLAERFKCDPSNRTSLAEAEPEAKRETPATRRAASTSVASFVSPIHSGSRMNYWWDVQASARVCFALHTNERAEEMTPHGRTIEDHTSCLGSGDVFLRCDWLAE